ncbi:MAG: serine/threonine protein kinase [Fimbriimonadales bacterium]|nr:serine/threonine protein kinase [Fimbriimonadales bacterium]
MSQQPTGTLGKYQIIREIARSNDIVYEAYDPLMNRRVALKEMLLAAGSTPQQREDRIRRFLREARAAGTLSHPNIMTVYEAGEADGRFYIAMEFLEGRTLRNELDLRGFLAPSEAVRIAEAVLDALQYAHERGVIHRDIKPENIQLLPDGRVKLTDFGIARLTFEPNLTLDGQVFGTPSYMSPEQVVGRELDLRTDLFSLGVVLYEMLSGQKPFQGDSVVAIAYAISNQEPAQPPQIPLGLWAVVRRALDKSPALRYGSAAEMAAALRQAMLDPVNPQPSAPWVFGAVAPPPAPIQPPPPPPAPGTAGPILAPYNPYQPSGAAPPPVPVYYPPPPRQPLLKPETKAFLAKLALTLVLMGTLLALILATVSALGNLMDRWRAERAESQRLRAFEQARRTASLDERIERGEQFAQNLDNPVLQAEARRRLAWDIRAKALEQIQMGRWAEAEASLTLAQERAPDEPRFDADRGWLYFERAARAATPEEQASFLLESGRRYRDALHRSNDPQLRQECEQRMAQAAGQLTALALMLRQDRDRMLRMLYDARSIAPPGSDVRQEIDLRLQALGR